MEHTGSNSSFEEDEFDECDAYSSCSLGTNGEAGTKSICTFSAFYKAFLDRRKPRLLFIFSLDRINDERLSVSGEESSASEGEDDALEEGDLEELEKTVLQFSDENPECPLTDAQV